MTALSKQLTVPGLHALGLPTNEIDPDINRLEIFTSIPHCRDIGVVAVEYGGTLLRAGEVAVYDSTMIGREGIIDGGLYAVEYQHPRAGMTWDMWWENGKRYGGRSAIETHRSVKLVKRSTKNPDHWYLHPIAAHSPAGIFILSDGPIPDHLIGEKLLGRIIGIYNPAALTG